jgi:hypothetical protein
MTHTLRGIARILSAETSTFIRQVLDRADRLRSIAVTGKDPKGLGMRFLTDNPDVSASTWNLPAGPGFCAGYSAAPGSPCISCYAMQGRYQCESTRVGLLSRWVFWRTAGTRTKVMGLAAECAKVPYVRVFSSGDFGSLRDIVVWRAIVRRAPKTKFWIPTRLAYRGGRYLRALQALQSEPNVVVRVSCEKLDTIRTFPGLLSSFVSTTKPCGKQVSGSCAAAGCRKCWNSNVAAVSYKLHGHKINPSRRRAVGLVARQTLNDTLDVLTQWSGESTAVVVSRK